MQAVGRWGNFFNQELYGPPTTLPWGIAIDCAHRVVPYGCDQYPVDTTFFHPLFLYESVSGILGAITLLWIARRWGARMRPGDLFLLFLIWYAVVRLALETLRTGNWIIGGIPTATIVSTLLIVGSLVALAIRHRPGASGDRWGEPPVDDQDLYDADDEETVEVDDETVEIDADETELDGARAGEADPGEADPEPEAVGDAVDGAEPDGDAEAADAGRPAPGA
jgi:hypothetical protein